MDYNLYITRKKNDTDDLGPDIPAAEWPADLAANLRVATLISYICVFYFLYLSAWGLASMGSSSVKAETASPASAPQTPWGETLNGIRMQVTAPSADPGGVVEYRRGRMVPLDLEIENVGPDPIPLKTIHAPSFKITDLRGNRIGVQGYLWSHIPPGKMAAGDLAPGQRIRDRVYLERLHWRLPDGADRKINLLFQLPTPKSVPNQLTINADANPVTVMMIDSPFDHPLKSSDLPDSWTKDLEIEYVESGFFFGSLQVRIDPARRVTAIGTRLQKGSTLGNGRFEFQLTPAQSDEWVRLLKDFRIERLNPYDGKRYASDLVQIHLCIALGGNTLVGQYEDYGYETPEVVAFRELINTMLAKLKPAEDK